MTPIAASKKASAWFFSGMDLNRMRWKIQGRYMDP